VPALRRAFAAFIRRHDAWRTVFSEVDGKPRQIVCDDVRLDLPVTSITHFPWEARESESRRIALEELGRDFGSFERQPVRALLVALRDEDHVLYVTAHSLVSDDASLRHVFVPELASMYRSESEGECTTAIEPVPPYADFALWQREAADEPGIDQLVNYWKERLADPPAVVLPIDRKRAGTQAQRPGFREMILSSETVDSLRDLCRAEGTSLYETLIAAFNVLLHRYSGQSDIIIGTETVPSGWTHFAGVMGPFRNTLVLRTTVDADLTFRAFLSRVADVVADARAHGDAPFELLVQRLGLERSGGEDPLFPLMVTFGSTEPLCCPGWTTVGDTVRSSFIDYDLHVDLAQSPDGISGSVRYKSELFDEETADRFVGHAITLLDAIAVDPDSRLSQLPLLPEKEIHVLLKDWNGRRIDPLTETLAELFEDQSERTPGAVALEFEDETLTYDQLNRRANQLAHYLRRSGARPETLVGICVERSINMVVGLLGIAKSGAAYVPLDPTYPRDRLAYMVEDARPVALVTQQSLQDWLPALGASVVRMDVDWEAIAREREDNPVRSALPTSLAYVIYTSGSTGKPKGVLIEHASLASYVKSAADLYEVGPHDRVLQFAPISFDASVDDLYPGLISGSTVVIRTDRMLDSASTFLETCQLWGITVLNLPTAYWHELASEIPVAGVTIPSCLRLVIIGGERAIPEKVASWLEHVGNRVRLLNTYGPTEATVAATYCDLSALELEALQGEVPIGRPYPGAQTYILDSSSRPLPIGAAGELYIGGLGVARGYLHRPDLTRERFVADPFSGKDGERLYRSGDLVRYQGDGTIEYLGRMDQQVKIRGFRIELGEIQALLDRHPSIRAAVVVAREDVPGDKYLVAYAVPASGSKISPGELRPWLREHLPDYMVPAAFVSVHALPLSPSGKVDTRSLPPPERSRSETEHEAVPAQTLLHHQLVQIWEEILDIRPIGIADNFFDLGGHSLLAVRLLHTIEQITGKRLPLASLFAGATIEHLADVLMQQTEHSDREPLVKVQGGDDGRPFFFLHGDVVGGGFYSQKLARQLGKEQPFYVLQPHGIDADQVPPSIEEMATSHVEALRSRQPEGPYVLGGYCNGGLVAFEMALQLQNQGQRVELLALINTDVPPLRSYLARRVITEVGRVARVPVEKQVAIYRLLQDWVDELTILLRAGAAERIRILPQVLKRAFGRARPLFARRRHGHGGHTVERDMTSEDARRRRMDPYLWAIAGYRPKTYAGSVTLFWPEKSPLRSGDPTMGWTKVARRVHIRSVPGTHNTSITQHVDSLGESLRCSLETARESGTDS